MGLRDADYAIIDLSRAGVYIKLLLVQCANAANAAVRSKDFPYSRVKFE